jgi:hypothetical protein
LVVEWAVDPTGGGRQTASTLIVPNTAWKDGSALAGQRT